jgi:hypothetical protein
MLTSALVNKMNWDIRNRDELEISIVCLSICFYASVSYFHGILIDIGNKIAKIYFTNSATTVTELEILCVQLNSYNMNHRSCTFSANHGWN